MKNLRELLLAALTVFFASPAIAVGVQHPKCGACNVSKYYKSFPSGVPSDPSFFPVAVWMQSPQTTGHSGAYSNEAAAMAGEGINIELGLWGNGSGWPEQYGADSGELAALKAAGVYLVAGGDYNGNTSNYSVASALALAAKDNALGTLIGYDLGDEPTCGEAPGQMGAVPGNVSTVTGYDPTRLTVWNMLPFVPWEVGAPYYGTCNGSYSEPNAAFLAPSIASFDNYPGIVPWFTGQFYCGKASYVRKSNFQNVAEDCLWMQGLGTTLARAISGGTKPFWQFVESGTDALEYSGQANYLSVGLSAGSKTVVNASGFSKFTKSWIGLTVSGTDIPVGTTIVKIVDDTHAVMSNTANATNASETAYVAGGEVNDCVLALNLCVVNGNEYRATAAQVNSEAWAAIINGANGIEWFCHDHLSNSFCLGDSAGGALATAVAANLTYIDGSIRQYAAQLNSPSVGICSMQNADLSVSTSCTNGVLTMTTDTAAVPGMAMAKAVSGVLYLFAESDRVSKDGARLTYTLKGFAGKKATVVYDSNTQYDPVHSHLGKTFRISQASQFTDRLGAHSNSYQVKIYAVK